MNYVQDNMITTQENKLLDKPKVHIYRVDNPAEGAEPYYQIGLQMRENQKNIPRYLTVTSSPFHNCQIYTIGGMSSILEDGYYQHHVKDILKEIQSHIDKSRLLIDIYNTTSNHRIISSIFSEEDVVFRQDYQNNTTSQMSVYLLRTIPLGYEETNEDNLDSPYYDEDRDDDNYDDDF